MPFLTLKEIVSVFSWRESAILIGQFLLSCVSIGMLWIIVIVGSAHVTIKDNDPEFLLHIEKADSILQQQLKPDSLFAAAPGQENNARLGYTVGVKSGLFLSRYFYKRAVVLVPVILSLLVTGGLFFRRIRKRLGKIRVRNEDRWEVLRTVVSHVVLFGIGIFTKRAAEQFLLYFPLAVKTRWVAFFAYIFIFLAVYANAFSNQWIQPFYQSNLFISISVIEYGGLISLIGAVLFIRRLRPYSTLLLQFVSVMIFVMTIVMTMIISDEDVVKKALFQETTKNPYQWGFQSLSTLSLVIGISLYLIVLRRVTVEKERVEGEIVIARRIQEGLLPEINLSLYGVEIYGKAISASEVGGDYFDAVDLGKGRIALIIGDVAGHNLAAGVMMAVVKSAVRTELRHQAVSADLRVSEVLTAINQTVIELRKKSMFVTLGLCVIDTQRGTINYANAGHLPLLSFSPSTRSSQRIYHKSMALGLVASPRFSEEQINVSKSETFIFLTDGVTEAVSKGGEEFELRRVQEMVSTTLSGASPLSLKEVYDRIIDSATRFTGKPTFQDDVSLLLFRVNKPRLYEPEA